MHIYIIYQNIFMCTCMRACMCVHHVVVFQEKREELRRTKEDGHRFSQEADAEMVGIFSHMIMICVMYLCNYFNSILVTCTWIYTLTPQFFSMYLRHWCLNDSMIRPSVFFLLLQCCSPTSHWCPLHLFLCLPLPLFPTTVSSSVVILWNGVSWCDRNSRTCF